ncbi:glycoside hydrolase family 65 protein [Planococcus halotolerans]|uniref:Glycoside hydrolase family 65 protein n=1 Tax=Planococcus halotolerans TaxID=2233542 RepID=A0A365KWN3_9BACL|nr:glycosyl hydrolase family 65 protein [Planococcus halotolerans]QHJ69196.1 glycoside hydrolase family 65 protein [Planococcus halotolerans]RAZ77601.1 glycoside hydrolase family 65 protein [Planococcus halotolerans]
MMDYSIGKGNYENWILGENNFSSLHLGKTETVMLLGNGYMGLRSANEEPYLSERRNLFINGTFNQADKNEVVELPNAADATRLDILIDGERFSLEFGETENYSKQLNIKDAELIRSFSWTSPEGKKLQFRFSRFVSFAHSHLIGMKMELKCLSGAVDVSIESGINAQMTNSGVQHFLEGDRRIWEDRFIQLVQTTTQSGIDFVHNTVHTLKLNDEEITAEANKYMERRKVWMSYKFRIEQGDNFELEKLTTVHTSRDKESDHEHYSLAEMQEQSLRELKDFDKKGYERLRESHRLAWQENVWDAYGFEVESENPDDQLAIHFSLYHLTAMTPAHDDRMGVGAKALSGEAYKGHSFWDTEIFILPFFIYSNPDTARSLLQYRYHGLPGARQKAAEQGYIGAMFPWEMAWPTDGEVTPEWGDIDIVTGERTKIWAGLIEHHLSADIAFAIYQYVNVTGDEEFLEQYGYVMVFETARFWASRFEWNEERERYEITDVIGPDEYKEHVSNNAFTNYMAYFNLMLAMRYAEKLEKENPELWKSLVRQGDHADWQSKAERLYLPEPRNEDLVLPQDDTYLELREIDLDKYKKQTKARTIYRDYNPEQINGIQVTKQADIILLFFLMEQTFLKDDPRFSKEAKRANFFYYEARTLHDSSLSLSTHAIAASEIGARELAYSLFRKTCEIDMGQNMHSSDDGIHAAAIGGIWKAAVFGFAGVRQTDGRLMINPRLPKEWGRMQFSIYWKGEPLRLDITKNMLKISAGSEKAVQVETAGNVHEFEHSIEITLTD